MVGLRHLVGTDTLSGTDVRMLNHKAHQAVSDTSMSLVVMRQTVLQSRAFYFQ